MTDISEDAKQWGNNLNNASWAAVNAWDSEVMGPMSDDVYNNIKGVVRAAILKYLEGYHNKDDQSSLKLSLVYAAKHFPNGPFGEPAIAPERDFSSVFKQIRLELQRINAHIDAAEAACEVDLYKAKGT